MRAAVLITVVTSLLTAAPSAWGAVRYVDAIGGVDAGECVQASPCESITYALGRPGAGDEIVVASGTYTQLVPLDITEDVDLHGVAGDPRPVITVLPGAGIDAVTVGGAAAGSRFSHLHFSLPGGAVGGSAAVRVTTPATFEDVAFTLTAFAGTPERRRALLVDLPTGTTAPVVLRGATVNANAGFAGHDGAGLLETAHGTLRIRDLVLSNVAEGMAALAAISAGTETQPDDAIVDVDGATITTRGRCLGLFGGSAAVGSTLRNLTVTQAIDGGGGSQATVECVRIGSRYTTIDGMKVTALESSATPGQYNESAIIAWNADNLTLRRIDVTAGGPALYAGPKTAGNDAVTNLQIHGARMQSLATSAVVIRNGTGRLTDLLAVGGSGGNTAGLHFLPGAAIGNQFALRNVTAIGGTGGSAGIYLDNGLVAGQTVTVTGRNVIARGSTADVFVSSGSSMTLDHSFVATIQTGSLGVYVDGGNNSVAAPGFVNAAGGDYHLAAGAAAENAGVTDSFVGTEDFEGDSRVGAGNPDVGADERRPATVPETAITGAPPASGTDPTVTFHFIADDATATFVCSVTGAVDCTSPFTPPALADGLYTFTVTASNATGPDPTPATFQFRVDSTAPNTAVSGKALTNDPTPAFALSSASEPTATFQCALDGAELAACPASYVAPTLSSGQHTLRVRAVDEAGNRDATPAELTFTVDTVRPNTTLKSGPKGTKTARTARFTFAASEAGSRFQCKLDRKAWASCKSPKTYKKLKAGKHTFQVRSIDKAGNVDATPAKRTWRIR